MKLISARQAWHDCYFEARGSVLAVAAERARLGKRGQVTNETHHDRMDTNGRTAHMLAAGLVQAAIQRLPKPLQHFGHTLYSPLADGNDVSIAHGLVWLGAGLDQMPERRRERAYWMALAAINSHKRAVNGRESLTPGDVCVFIEERIGVRLNPAHWARDWAATWEKLAKHIDRLDAQALKPVAEVVAKDKGLRRQGWRWLEVDRLEVIEHRSRQYASRREEATEKLASRLASLSAEQMTAWLARMRVYSKAYRAEWGAHLLEHPLLHAQYHDRVSAYWTQRQRSKRVA